MCATENRENIKDTQDMENVAARVRELRKLIEYHSNAYYNADSPEIEDDEYDALMRELRGLEEKYPRLRDDNSPTVKVGGAASSKFDSVTHEVPMQSLQDVFSLEEVEEFCAKFPNAEFVVEKKIDGLSVSLEYTDGILTRGSTRGDGRVGEDITENLLTIASIPHRINTSAKFIEVRGEVYMPRKTFAALNEYQEENGLKTFKNPRNAAAGSLRQKDAAITASRSLDIFVFNVQQARGVEFTTHSQALEFLAKCGFRVSPEFAVVKNYSEAAQAIGKIGSQRGELEYDIDGAVVKINDLNLREEVGVTSKFPKWAVAFKYPPEQKETTLRDIEVTVGRTGVLTPTGVFDPVMLAGTSVGRASLHNQDYITQKDIRIGDMVVLRKAGEIIPEVVSVAKHCGGEPYVLPEFCPSCGDKVFRLKDEAALRCVNPECPAQLLRNIIHFASRDAMDIEGMGPAVIEQLIARGMVNSPADIYKLTPEDVASLDRMGKKSAQNLVNSVEKSKSNALYRLIFALGIRHIGEAASRQLSEQFGSMQALMNASPEDFAAIEGFGEVMAQSVCDYFSTVHARELTARLAEYGVNMEARSDEGSAADSQALSGLTFVITGTLDGMTRDEAKALIVANGGKASSSVSKKTSYLLAGENGGSKLTKAEELGVKIISLDELREMLGNS